MSEKQNKIKLSDLKIPFIHFLLCGLLYFLLSLPFTKFTNNVLLTEMNPSNCLPQIFGMLMGWPAIIGCAVSDFVLNYVSGLSFGFCFCGFFVTLIYGLVPAVLWMHFTRRDKKNRLRINSLRKLIYFLITIFISSIVNATLTGFEDKFISGINFFSTQTLFILLNNVIFCIIIGFPVFFVSSILNQKLFGKNNFERTDAILSINEKIILFFVMISVLLVACITLNLHYNYKNLISDKIVLWNKIYITDILVLSVLFWTGVIVQIFVEKKVTRPLEKMAGISTHYGENEDSIQNNNFVINLCKEYASYNSEIGNLARSYIYMASD